MSNSACSVEYCSRGAFAGCSGFSGLVDLDFTDSGTLYGVFLGLLFFAYHRACGTDSVDARSAGARMFGLVRGSIARLSIMGKRGPARASNSGSHKFQTQRCFTCTAPNQQQLSDNAQTAFPKLRQLSISDYFLALASLSPYLLSLSSSLTSEKFGTVATATHTHRLRSPPRRLL